MDVLVLGTRTIHVDVAAFREAVAGAPVKLITSFDCFHATDGYHGDQSLERRGGYSCGEGHGSSNDHAPLPVTLRYDATASTFTLPVWERVKPGTTATLRLVLFNHAVPTPSPSP